MAEPSFLGGDTTPRTRDTQWMIRAKILGYYQNQAGAVAKNNPSAKDTRYWQKRKILAALNGV